MLKIPFNNNSLLTNKKRIRRKYQNLINQINTLENELKTLTDSELRVKSSKLKNSMNQHKI